jgi:tetratricopeptide (TPR) repeat protein
MKRVPLKVWFVLLCALGILLRIVYLVEIRKSPFFFAPFGDPEVFDTWSLSIAHGDFFSNGIFFKAPLYPYILAVFYKIFGHNLFIPRILNIFFDTGSLVLLFLIGRTLFNRTVGLISLGIGAVSGILIYFSGEVLGTSLAVLLSLASLYCLLVSGDRLLRWFVSGILVSLAILVRPNFFLSVPLIVLYIVIQRKPFIRRFSIGAVFLAGLAILISLTTIRNYVAGKDFVLVNYSGGVNFYIGNNAQSDGVSAVLPGYGNDWDEYSVAERETGRDLKPSEVSRFWFRKGVQFIFRYPGKFFLLSVKKAWLVVNGKEISNNQNIYRYAHRSIILRPLLFSCGTRNIYFSFSTSLVFSFCIAGMILSMRRREGLILPLLIIVSFALSIVIFFVSSRYRMVLFALVIPFSGYTVSYLFEKWKERWTFMVGVFTLLPFLILCNVDPYGVSMENEALECYNLGNVYMRTGELEKAKLHYNKGISENYTFPRLHMNLGSVYFKEKNYCKAESEYLIEIGINPNDGRSYHNLSLVYEKQGRIEDAIRYEKKAISLLPRFFDAYRNVGRLYIKKEQFDSALTYLVTAERLNGDDVKVISLLGLVNMKKRKYKDAIQYYKKAVEKTDDDPFLFYNLGVSYIAVGRKNEAREALKRAVTIKDNFPEAHFNLGLVYLQEGDTVFALKHLEKAVSLDPGLSEGKKLIEKLR